MWFAGSATGTGDVSHNSRWGKVSGWRRASPLSSHCFKQRAFVSGHGSARTGCAAHFGSGTSSAVASAPSRRSMSSSESASRSTSSVTGGFHRSRGGRRCWSCGPATHVVGDQRRDLADGARAHQTGRRQGHADGRFERVFDFDAHQRIQSEIGQRLVVAQTVWLDAQHRADDIAHRLRR